MAWHSPQQTLTANHCPLMNCDSPYAAMQPPKAPYRPYKAPYTNFWLPTTQISPNSAI